MQKKEEAINNAHLFLFNGDTKAGMQNIDKEKQNQIIYDMSKDSSYFKRAKDLDEKNEAKILKFKEKIKEMKHHHIVEMKKEVTRNFEKYENSRNLNRICVVLDFDMFFAAVEIRDQPHLKLFPCAVGSIKGTISTANYVAREYGVRSAMPGFIAKKLCPQLVFLDVNFEKYEKDSNILKNIVQEYDQRYISHSLDEIYFDITDISRSRAQSIVINSTNVTIFDQRKAACIIVAEIRARIEVETRGLTASAGIANNFMLAKISADCNKPNGQFEIAPTKEAIGSFLENLPCRKVGGIGKVSERTLSELGCKTMGDVRVNLFKLIHILPSKFSSFLCSACLGISTDELEGINENIVQLGLINRKSLGTERTFNVIEKENDLLLKLKEICGKVEEYLKKEKLFGKSVSIKLKNEKFEVISRQSNSKICLQSAIDIENIAFPLLKSCLPLRVRLLGVKMSDLIKEEDVKLKNPTSISNLSSPNIKKKLISTTIKTDHISKDFPIEDNKQFSLVNINYSKYDNNSNNNNNNNNNPTHHNGIDRLFHKINQNSTVVAKRDNEIFNEHLIFNDFTEYNEEDNDYDETENLMEESSRVYARYENEMVKEESSSSNNCKSTMSLFNLACKSNFTCPKCNITLYTTELGINLHIDKCLQEKLILFFFNSSSSKEKTVNTKKRKQN
jgi:DNA polymerase kappa